VKFTKLAKTFGARVEMALSVEGPWFDAKSIVKVMAARAPKGTVLQLRATGDDADRAVRALVGLVERDFDEGEAHARTA
jgi:phosphocarrier protein